jgi:hypothetical protein
MVAIIPDADWEAMHAPYDPRTYQAVLDRLGREDVVLDIGAGDLRLARQMAGIVRKVYAVEIDAAVLRQADEPPANLTAVCGDARAIEFPCDVTTGVLLMRHCTCFRLYAEKLRSAGAARLITNARWRMDVEVVDLHVEREPLAATAVGWYACWCGAVGFQEGRAEQWSADMDRIVHEGCGCPQCMST